MKKFQFSLSHMRDYQERVLDEERGVLLRLKDEEARIEKHILQLDEEFADISQRLLKAQEEGTTIMELRGMSLQLESIRVQRKELVIELKRAHDRVERQTKVVLAANQEVSKLDKLEEKQYEEYKLEANRAEEQRIEELVTQSLIRKDAV